MRIIYKLGIDDCTGNIILTRWWIRRLRGLKLHKFSASDRDPFHDHPWPFITFIFWGSYLEETESGFKEYKAPRLLYRSAEWKHRVLLIDNKPCWTLVLTFKKKREWGFYTEAGWVNWLVFLRRRKKC